MQFDRGEKPMLDTFKKATPEAMRAIKEEMDVRRTKEVFLLFALGSQFDHLIYQALSKLGVYCLVADPASVTAKDVAALRPIGIILSGGPASVETEPPPFDSKIFDLGIPVLGICLGFQMWAKYIGLKVFPAEKQEFGVHELALHGFGQLFHDCPTRMPVLQSHGDRIEPGRGMYVYGFTENAVVAAGSYFHLHGVQFHPEVPDTTEGLRIFENFCFKICGAKDRFPAKDIAERKIEKLQEETKGKCVLLLLSGGSDSSTVAYLLKEALRGEQRLRGVYIKGIDRPDDEAFVLKHFADKPWINLKIVDATERFLEVLSPPKNIFKRFWRWLTGKTPRTMKKKRLAMRGIYKAVAEEEAARFSEETGMPVNVAQGTLYTDISESGGGHSSGARKAVIKVHHNTNLGFRFPELTPLDDCVKDSGRNIGREIGVPEELLVRHPFPGPGMVVRIEGPITRENLAMARQLDGIYIEELRRAGLYILVWQAGAVVTSSMHTYTKGDDAGSGPVIAIWAVYSVNGFTAQAAELPFSFRKRLARRIGNEVRGVGAVTERISDKPFSTIEWG